MGEFSDINFKYSDAEEEMLYAPELVKSAFVDIDHVLQKADVPGKFIVVGPKGAGKTALASKLLTMSQERWNYFVDTDILEQFEFQLLKKTGALKAQQVGGALTVWQVLLILRLTPLFLTDEQLQQRNPTLAKFCESLSSFGLGPGQSLTAIVQQTSRRGAIAKIKTAIAEFGGDAASAEDRKIKDPAAILDAIKVLFSQINPADSKYFLILDGLDYILRDGRNNAAYIADLINAARQVNTFFYSVGVSAKVMILIRNEVLQIVPDPNLTKRLVDNGVELRWYDNARSPFDTDLLRVVQKRANLAGLAGNAKGLWHSWFPSTIHDRSSLDFILVNTRYLPRDLISFFREVQRLRKQPPFSEVDVLSALNTYSDWFLQELRDSLVGLVDEDVRVELPSMISELGRQFSVAQLRTKLEERGHSDPASAEQIARALFNTCWIGNVWETERGTSRYSWRHRKINARLNLQYKLQVHNGLWKTLNLV